MARNSCSARLIGNSEIRVRYEHVNSVIERSDRMNHHNLVVSKRVTRRAIRIALAMLFVLGAVSAALAARDVQSALHVPVSVQASINSNSCDNSPKFLYGTVSSAGIEQRRQ